MSETFSASVTQAAGEHPDAKQLLAEAVANCLAASLRFCLDKARIEVGDIRCDVEGDIKRISNGRLRISQMRVTVEPTVNLSDLERMGRCSDLFEDFCTVTQSIRSGIDVQVELIAKKEEMSGAALT